MKNTICPKCKQKYDEQFQFCPQCGRKLRRHQTESGFTNFEWYTANDKNKKKFQPEFDNIKELGAEAVLDPGLTSAILNPVTNAAFTNFTDSLASLFQLAGGGVGLPSSRFGGSVSNLYGGNTYIEGVRIGSDMMSRPLSEVLSTLNLYKNH